MTSTPITFEQLCSELQSINPEAMLYIEMLQPDSRCRTGIRVSAKSLKVTDMLTFWDLGQTISIAPCDYITKTTNEGTYYNLDYDALRITIWIED